MCQTSYRNIGGKPNTPVRNTRYDGYANPLHAVAVEAHISHTHTRQATQLGHSFGLPSGFPKPITISAQSLFTNFFSSLRSFQACFLALLPKALQVVTQTNTFYRG